MVRPEILQGLAAAARKELGFEGELHAGLRLVEDLQLDSIRLLSLAMAVEDHFQIALDADDEAGIVTVGDLLALIEKKLDEKKLDEKKLDETKLDETKPDETKPGGDGAS